MRRDRDRRRQEEGLKDEDAVGDGEDTEERRVGVTKIQEDLAKSHLRPFAHLLCPA